MMKRLIISAAFLAAMGMSLWPSSAAESDSAARGKYLAGRGIIIPPEEIYVESYIAQIDYRYPLPDGPLGVSLYSGRRRLSAGGQEEVIHVGIQGGRRSFYELPPMNLAFVIDRSGSMEAEDKMSWVRDAFDIFIRKIRDVDFVSLVFFNHEAEVAFPSTRMNSAARRRAFKEAVHLTDPAGGTNLAAGLTLGYRQVLKNYRRDYTNRVLFLTDGVGESEGVLEMAEEYSDLGINVSTIGVGVDFDLELMRELARRGGGSSRFISDRVEMEKTFGSELDRMAVPVARDLTIDVTLAGGVKLLETWGYDHQIREGGVRYRLPTLHHGDYETILLQVMVSGRPAGGEEEIAGVEVAYSDLVGDVSTAGPYALSVSFVEADFPVEGFSSPMVLQSGMMMRFAQALRSVGKLYYGTQETLTQINQLRDRLWNEREADSEVAYEDLTSSQIEDLEDGVRVVMQESLDITQTTLAELKNARLRLEDCRFDDETGILNNYVEILGKELDLSEERRSAIVLEEEWAPAEVARSLNDHLRNLALEIAHDLPGVGEAVIAVSRFVDRSGRSVGLSEMTENAVRAELLALDNLKLVPGDAFQRFMEREELRAADLRDTDAAIEAGLKLAADYIVTGSIVETSGSVIIFGRLIRIGTGEVESVAQVVVPKSDEVMERLGDD